MGFWTLLEGFLLFANALAILNEDRFLAPWGWTLAELRGNRRNTLKGQIIGLIHTRYERKPSYVTQPIARTGPPFASLKLMNDEHL